MLNNRQVQLSLNYLGFNCGKVDGIIGFRTKSAIKNFKKSFEITVNSTWTLEADIKIKDIVRDIQRKIGATPDGLVGRRNYRKN